MARRVGAVVAAAAVIVAVLVVTRETGSPSEARPVAAPVIRHCDSTSPGGPLDRRFAERDIRAGRLTIVAFRGNFERARAGDVYTRGGAKVLKAGVVFTGGRDLTLSTPSGALKLDYIHGRKPVRSLRFEACPGRGGATGYPGGFVWRGPWPACVPLDVSGVGRVMLPLGRRCS